jgi:hypothetical protein
MRAQLTEITVRSLKPAAGKQLKVWDTKTPGFGVRIKGRTKSFSHFRAGSYDDRPRPAPMARGRGR